MKDKDISNIKEKHEIYNEMTNSITELEIKNKNMSFTSTNGNMFSFINKDGEIALRLSNNDRNELINKYHTSLVISSGVIMNDYVLIPDKMIKNKDELNTFFLKSFEYAKTLKPK